MNQRMIWILMQGFGRRFENFTLAVQL
jgi:hypothetical protein